MFRTNPKKSCFAFTAVALFPPCGMVWVHIHPVGKACLDQHTAGTSVWRLLQWERENLKNIHKDQIKISYEALIRLDMFPKDIPVVTSAYQLKICERAATSHLLQPLINGGWESTLCSTGLFHSELQLYATLVSVKLILSQNVIYKYSGKCTTPNNDIILKTFCR